MLALLHQSGVCLDDRLLAVAGKSTAMVIHCNADALAAAGSVLLGLSPVIRFLCNDFQHLRQLDILNDVTVCGRFVTLLADMLLLEFQGIDAEMACDVIHMSFNRKERLRCAEAAESAGREGVGANALALEVGVGNGINAVAVENAALKHNVRGGQVCAAVIVDMTLHTDDLSVLDCGFIDALGRMALNGELCVLFAVKDHFDRLADPILRNQKCAADDIGEVLLAAERAAGRGLPDDDVIIGNIEQTRNGLADVEGALCGRIEDELSVLIGRNRAVGFQVHMLLIGRGDGLLKDLVCLSKDFLHRSALFAEQLTHNIAALFREHRAADAVDAVINAYRRSFFLIVDFDLLFQFFQNGAIRTDNQADRLTDIENIVLRKASPVLQNHPKLVPALGRNVLRGDKMIAFRHFRKMNVQNFSSRNRGANHVCILHIGECQVADVHRLAACFLGSIHAGNFIANFGCRHCLASLH